MRAWPHLGLSTGFWRPPSKDAPALLGVHTTVARSMPLEPYCPFLENFSSVLKVVSRFNNLAAKQFWDCRVAFRSQYYSVRTLDHAAARTEDNSSWLKERTLDDAGAQLSQCHAALLVLLGSSHSAPCCSVSGLCWSCTAMSCSGGSTSACLSGMLASSTSTSFILTALSPGSHSTPQVLLYSLLGRVRSAAVIWLCLVIIYRQLPE